MDIELFIESPESEMTERPVTCRLFVLVSQNIQLMEASLSKDALISNT